MLDSNGGRSLSSKSKMLRNPKFCSALNPRHGNMPCALLALFNLYGCHMVRSSHMQTRCICNGIHTHPETSPRCRWSNSGGVTLVASQTLHTEGPQERQSSGGAAKRCDVIDDCCLLWSPVMRLHLYQNTMTDDSQQRKGHSVWLSAQKHHFLPPHSFSR